MKARVSSIIGWICTVLVVAFNLFAAVMKFMPVTPGSPAEEFGKKLGTIGLEHPLGVLEFAIIILFLVPRTSAVGFILMIGYLAGALATNLTHGFSSMEALPIYVLLALMAVIGWTRFPEFTARLRGTSILSA